ncbi:glycoside hydrolase family 19 protein, partial [Amycolatopsis sp. NPDC003861]
MRRRLVAVLSAVAAVAGLVFGVPAATGQAPQAAAAACSAPNWVAGQWYDVGAVVRYTNGGYYRAKNANPGYDPVISTW